MNKNKVTVRDFFWVLSAFVRGKLLKQKAYQPKPWGNNNSIMYGMKGMNFRRLSLLMKWWGLRPMTLKELQDYLNPPARPASRVLYLNWDEGEQKWKFYDKSTDPWGDNDRFRFLAR